MKQKRYGKYTVLVALLLGQLMTPMDGAMVNVALPSIGEDLSISITATGWILVVYFLFTCSFMVTFGRAGDLLGRKKLFLVGVLLFLAGTVLSGLSINYGMLLAARSLQALGGGMFSANLPALVTSIFPEDERGKALGITATAVSIALAVGPFLGGLLSGTLGWRYVFFINVPFGIAAAVLGFMVIPESRRPAGESLDVAGAILLLVVLAPFALALSQGRSWGWSSPAVTGLFVAALCFALVLIWRELRTAHPLIDLALFRMPSFTLSNLVSFASFVGMQAVFFVTPFFLQYSIGMVPLSVGLVMSVANATALLLLFLSGALSDRVGTLPLETAGMGIFAVSMGLLALAGANLTLLLIIISLVILGIGYGIFRSPNYSAVMGSVPGERLGVAGGVYGTMRTTGFLTGIAMAGSVMGSWAAKRPTATGAVSAFKNPAFQAAVRHAYLAAMLVVVGGLLLCLLKYRYRAT